MVKYIIECFYYACMAYFIETIFTGFINLFDGKKTKPSLIMAPLYFFGYMACSNILGWLFYTLKIGIFPQILLCIFFIYVIEYSVGTFLEEHFDKCPWRYNHHIILNGKKIKMDYKGKISFLWAPFWGIFSWITLSYYNSFRESGCDFLFK